MSRRALLLSVALHAAMLVLVGRWIFPPHAGPGITGTGVSFSAAGGGGLLVEIPSVPAAGPTFATLPSPPDIAPETPPIEPPHEPVEILTVPVAIVDRPLPRLADAPALKPVASTSKSHRANAPSGSRGANAPGPSRGSEAAGSGNGLANAGQGSGGGGGPGYVPPSFRLRYKPPYPEEARALRLEGTAILLVSLDATGHVLNASLQRTCGHAILDRAALKAVRTWLFDPARQNGIPIAAVVEVPVRFRFEERAEKRT